MLMRIKLVTKISNIEDMWGLIGLFFLIRHQHISKVLRPKMVIIRVSYKVQIVRSVKTIAKNIVD